MSPPGSVPDDTGSHEEPGDPGPPLSDVERRRLNGLLRFLEESVPERYRERLLDHLLPRILGSRPSPAGTAARGADPLETYRPLLERRGDTLLKALAGLRLGEVLLGLEWMTPREIVDLLRDDAGVRSLYRSNVSNALREATREVRRRRRGRGFEYALGADGRRQLDREVRLDRGLEDG